MSLSLFVSFLVLVQIRWSTAQCPETSVCTDCVAVETCKYVRDSYASRSASSRIGSCETADKAAVAERDSADSVAGSASECAGSGGVALDSHTCSPVQCAAPVGAVCGDSEDFFSSTKPLERKSAFTVECAAGSYCKIDTESFHSRGICTSIKADTEIKCYVDDDCGKLEWASGMRALCSNDNKCFLPAEVPYMEVAGDGEEFCKNFLAFFDAESGKCRLMREKESCSRFSLVCGVGLTCDFQECRNTTIAGEGERCDVPFQATKCKGGLQCEIDDECHPMFSTPAGANSSHACADGVHKPSSDFFDGGECLAAPGAACGAWSEATNAQAEARCYPDGVARVVAQPTPQGCAKAAADLHRCREENPSCDTDFLIDQWCPECLDLEFAVLRCNSQVPKDSLNEELRCFHENFKEPDWNLIASIVSDLKSPLAARLKSVATTSKPGNRAASVAATTCGKPYTPAKPLPKPGDSDIGSDGGLGNFFGVDSDAPPPAKLDNPPKVEGYVFQSCSEEHVMWFGRVGECLNMAGFRLRVEAIANGTGDGLRVCPGCGACDASSFFSVQFMGDRCAEAGDDEMRRFPFHVTRNTLLRPPADGDVLDLTNRFSDFGCPRDESVSSSLVRLRYRECRNTLLFRGWLEDKSAAEVCPFGLHEDNVDLYDNAQCEEFLASDNGASHPPGGVVCILAPVDVCIKDDVDPDQQHVYSLTEVASWFQANIAESVLSQIIIG